MTQTIAETKQTIGGRPVDPTAPLLELDNLQVEFRTRNGVAKAVNGVSFSVNAGDTLGVIGESGCGKSVTSQAIMGIIDSPPGFVTGGEIRFRGVNLLSLPEKQQRTVRAQHIAMVFQDALSALNPVLSVGFQIGELFRKHRGMSRADARKRAVELLDLVRIPEAARRVGHLPHQFSGGMRQRVMIAMALALDPELLIADEPTTALDVTVQAQIMNLLAEIQAERHMGLILITHDMGVVAEAVDRVVVMYAGRVVEQAEVGDLYGDPAHPYTRALLRSVPRADLKGRRLEVIEGLPPNLTQIPPGCAFSPRCNNSGAKCTTDVPDLVPVAAGHRTACHYWEEARAK